jgi:hypothetical protein
MRLWIWFIAMCLQIGRRYAAVNKENEYDKAA